MVHIIRRKHSKLFIEEEERRIIRRKKIGEHEREVIAGG